MLWYVVGGLAAAITTFGFLPQVVKMWRTRSVGDLSPVMFLQFLVGLILWTAYAFHLGDPIIIASNLVALVVLLVAIALYYRFARQRSL